MTGFKIGQRWISEPEPELGLGTIELVEKNQVKLAFNAANEVRIYASDNAPIKRVQFCKGDTIYTKERKSFVIESAHERDGLITYVSGDTKILETMVADSTHFSKPEDRLIKGQTDSTSSFSLRYETMQHRHTMRQSEVSGFIGGRIDLIPHQLYVASEVAKRYAPRVLLADEVGLGKTIEACLILQRLHLTGRAERILILLPESLVHQWFVELLRRFNLWFTILGNEHCAATSKEESGVNPFLEKQLIICGLDSLLDDEILAHHAAAVQWDMLVVDEAHHLDWTPQRASPGYQLVEALATKSHGLLLLTATPEQLGIEGHFARLRLLDTERYPDLEAFKVEQAEYSKIAAVARQLSAGQKLSEKDLAFLRSVFKEFDDTTFIEHLKKPENLLDELIDRHGTGRVIFRNSRGHLSGFPERKALPKALGKTKNLSDEAFQKQLSLEFDLGLDHGKDSTQAEPLNYRHGARIKWLAEMLRNLGEEKLLLICRTREKVQAIYDALSEELNVKAAVFHEGLTLLQRDRNAAWFADPEGARILLCSEIGSEGRNFQFAHHLVLFDLPLNPELLEQRIGRLDRIGQTKTIRVHLPFLEHSFTELLLNWHHKGLDGVENPLKGGRAYLDKFGDTLRRLGPAYYKSDPCVLSEADQLVKESRRFSEALEQNLCDGQDYLVACNSFRKSNAQELIEQIRKQDDSCKLDSFMNRVFDHFGVTVDDLGERTVFLSPGQLFTDAFPELPEEGIQATYDRKQALGREDIGFLTWDHPMVRGAVDLVLGTERGNSCIVVWPSAPDGAPPILIEAIYALESIAPAHLHVDRFLPPTPIRVLIGMGGQDFSDTFSHALINKKTRDEEAFRLEQDPELLRSLIQELLQSALAHANIQKEGLLVNAVQKAQVHLDGEAKRLKELRKLNPGIRLEEIELAERVVKEVTYSIAHAELRLDSIRLILATFA